MKYECPSCKMNWRDTSEPKEMMSHPLCVFCSGKHTQKELLNWRMDHLKDIPLSHYPDVLRHFYKYIDHELKLIREKLHE